MSDEATRVMSDTEMNAADRLAEKRLAEARTQSVDSAIDARVQDYLGRPYRMEVRGNPVDGYVATAPELPGCMTAGETPEDALRSLRDAMAAWLEATIVAGLTVPEPDGDRFSGRMLLRMPKSLHARLAEQAVHENVSFNQLAVTLLAEGLGREQSGLLADVKRALDISGIPPGPEREVRLLVGAMIRALAVQERWDPSMDTPGSTNTDLANAVLRLFGSIPPGALEDILHRISSLQPRHAAREPFS